MAHEDLVITKDIIKKWSGEEMQKYMRDDATRARIVEVVEGLNPAEILLTDEETAALEAKAELEAQQAAEAEAAANAEALAQIEAARLAEENTRLAAEAEAARLKAIEDAKPKKIILEYQPEDENGNPIGRKTHLEAATWEEMSQKQKTAHIEATRAFHRLKTRQDKITPKKTEVEVVRMTDDEILQAANDLKSDDEDKAVAAQRKIDADRIIEERQALQVEKENARQAQVSYAFMRNHVADFNPCNANAQILSDYLRDNGWDWTVDNLEVAFAATESQLAPVPQAIPAPVQQPETTIQPTKQVVNPPAAAPTAVAAPVVAPIPPVAPVVNPPAAAPRRIGGGVIPGETLTGRPTVSKPVGLTKKDIAKWSGPTMLKEMKSSPARRAEIERVLATR